MTHTTPTPIRASTPLRAPATPVPASMSGETPPHKRRAKENADEQSDSTLGEVKGMFQEMFVGLQQQFMQMRADLQQQITQMRDEMSQRFDTLEGNRKPRAHSFPPPSRLREPRGTFSVGDTAAGRRRSEARSSTTSSGLSGRPKMPPEFRDSAPPSEATKTKLPAKF
ncbi:hypothetical protein HPB51_024401 [Rhipicephalus microplus]|uniref:Uncharacterized protein n=1 Tax=Rhipicephalus microplus TaxID=6941 RepID=A0A9J6DXA1_RHIMP|nr:hypothetical protein HPB51_024401 [Rhipicephalus microplus]